MHVHARAEQAQMRLIRGSRRHARAPAGLVSALRARGRERGRRVGAHAKCPTTPSRPRAAYMVYVGGRVRSRAATAHSYPAMRCLVPDCPLCLRHRALALAPAAADAGTLTATAIAALKGSLRVPPDAAPLSLAAHAFTFASASDPPSKLGAARSPSAKVGHPHIPSGPGNSSLGPLRAPSGLPRSPSGLARSATGPTRSSPSALRTPRTKAGISRSCSAAPARTLSPLLLPMRLLAACVRLRDAARGGEKAHREKEW
jgi:hypothetical protein